jgi:hypothetical protein
MSKKQNPKRSYPIFRYGGKDGMLEVLFLDEEELIKDYKPDYVENSDLDEKYESMFGNENDYMDELYESHFGNDDGDDNKELTEEEKKEFQKSIYYKLAKIKAGIDN